MVVMFHDGGFYGGDVSWLWCFMVVVMMFHGGGGGDDDVS